MLANARVQIIPELWATFQEAHRLFLLEVACSPDSVLAEAALKTGRTAERASIYNGFDLTSPEGLRKTLKLIKEQRPQHVWISTECGAFSPIQNLNQRTEQQRQDLAKKQREARKQHLGGLVVAYYAHQLGAQVYWEWSRRCRAWKWELIDRMRHKLGMHTSIVGGCRVGLSDPKTGSLVGKEWRVESTSQGFSQTFHLPCLQSACEGNHTRCEGNLTRHSAFYTHKFAARAIKCMSNNNPGLAGQEGNEMRRSQMCLCREFRFKGMCQACAGCILGESDEMKEVGKPVPNAEAWVAKTEDFTEEERRKWLHKIDLLHSATGHGSKEQLKQALQHKGVDPRIIKLVDSHRCASCEERKRPAPRRMSTLEVHPPRWKVMLADNAVWNHPRTKVRNVIAVYMDQCSRFMVGKILIEHPTKHPNADMYVKCFEEQWQQYFGKPETLRFDAEGTWRSRELDDRFGRLGVMMDPIPGDAHWHLSPLERAIGWLKECLSRMVGQDPDLSAGQALAQAVSAWNKKETVRGYSPRQHALGQVPDPCDAAGCSRRKLPHSQAAP